MASIGGGNLDAERLIRIIRFGRLINKTLIAICGQENLSKLGVKADLQNRIIERIQTYANTNDVKKFERLKAIIENPAVIPAYGHYVHVEMASAPANPADAATIPTSSTVLPNTSNIPGATNTYHQSGQPIVQFKPSPYYVVVEQLGAPVVCAAMTSHRHTARIALSASQYPTLGRIANNPSLRVMVFGAAEGPGRQDISFPHQSEIKINGGEIKANLRGLKSKPGSTRPVDITPHLRLHPPIYVNNVEMTYALTSKKYYLVALVIQVVAVVDLVKKLADGKRITEKTVIAEMVNKARDADIVTMASVLSLKCPLSTLRIDLPCRSTSCRHTQCFDATSYLQLQEQGPTWACPICNNAAPFESLAVDEYVKKILENTSKSVDQVTIQPDGKWELHDNMGRTSKPDCDDAGSDSDNDLVEIRTTVENVRSSHPHNASSVQCLLSEPLSESMSREPAPRHSLGSKSNKRPITAVIDLTSSGDEDEEPIARAPKRVYNNYGLPPNLPVYAPPPSYGFQPTH